MSMFARVAIVFGVMCLSNAANSQSIYTSSVTHYAPAARCHPECKLEGPDGKAEGDWYSFREGIPYNLVNASAHLLCEGVGCAHDGFEVTIDNTARIAHLRVFSRSSGVNVRLRANIE